MNYQKRLFHFLFNNLEQYIISKLPIFFYSLTTTDTKYTSWKHKMDVDPNKAKGLWS